MLVSQIAPCRMAPRPVSQKFLPERMELRQGVHDGALTEALVKSTPLWANLSKFGVSATSLMVPGPSVLAYALACLPQSSAKANRMFGALEYEGFCKQVNTHTAKKTEVEKDLKEKVCFGEVIFEKLLGSYSWVK